MMVGAIGQAGAISLRPHQSRAPVGSEREPHYPVCEREIVRDGTGVAVDALDTHRSPFSAWIAFERRLGLRIELAPLDRRVGRLRRENLVEVLHEADCVLDCHQGALVHFRS